MPYAIKQFKRVVIRIYGLKDNLELHNVYIGYLHLLKIGDEIYYVYPDGEIESGIVDSVFYEAGILESFSVDFSTEEWVGFSGLSLGVLCFRTIEEAVQCRKNIHAKNIK